MQKITQKISSCLWFDTQAEEAAKFYTSIFKNSSIDKINRYGENGPGPEGSVLTVAFTLDGQQFVGLNGGPHFKFTEAVSFVVNCADQLEIDMFWDKLTADGGQESMCGWLKDKFGLSWQIVPANLGEIISGDGGKAGRAMAALMKMRKLDIKVLAEA